MTSEMIRDPEWHVDPEVWGRAAAGARIFLSFRAELHAQALDVTVGDFRFRPISEIIADLAEDTVKRAQAWALDENDPGWSYARKFAVTFLTFPVNKKIQIIKEVREITGLNLKDSKFLVDQLIEHELPVCLGGDPPIADHAYRVHVEQQISQLRRVNVGLEDEAKSLREQLENSYKTMEGLKKARANTDYLLKKIDVLIHYSASLQALVKMAGATANPQTTLVLEDALAGIRQRYENAIRDVGL